MISVTPFFIQILNLETTWLLLKYVLRTLTIIWQLTTLNLVYKPK